MNSIINFLLESFICIGAFYLLYELLQKKETCFKYNRFYLLATAFLSLLIPVINIQLQTNSEALHTLTVEQVVYLPEVVIGNNSQASTTLWHLWPWALLFMYGFGVLFFLIKNGFELFKIFKIINTHSHTLQGKTKIIPTEGKLPTFSFLNYVFWDNSNQLNEQEKEYILAHERIHINHWHSLDLILMEILGIVFWFNPIIRLYKRALAETHEYIADQQTVSSAENKDLYKKTLVKQSLHQMNFALGHHFNKSQILKRIRMIEISRKTNWLKLTIVIPIIGALLLVFSCHEELILPEKIINVPKNLPFAWEIVESPSSDSKMIAKLLEIQSKHPEGDFHIVSVKNIASLRGTEFSMNGNENWRVNTFTSEKLEDNSVNIIGIAEYSATGRFIEKHAIEEVPVRGETDPEDEIFTIVEDQPQPIGGMAQFYQSIQANLEYPASAQSQGIEGKVFVQFVVDKDGSLTNVKVVKGIGSGCDEAAVKVIQNADKWKPGQQRGKNVRVRMILPITFRN